MSEQSEHKETNGHRRRHSRSMFGPVILIAAGVMLLLNNLGTLPDLNWTAALRLWPLFLIFIGVNIIAQQAPRPFGSLLSALVGVGAVAVFGYVLFFADTIPALRDVSDEMVRETVQFSADGVQTAVVDLTFNSAGTDLYALEDSNNLIEGSVTYTGDLIFEADESGGRAEIRLNTRDSGFNPFFWLDPASWTADDLDRWQIGLNPTVPTDLRLDLASGSVDLDLRALTLTDLTIDGASGSSRLSLPGGAYDMRYDVASGSATFLFPDSGRHTFDIEGASGSMSILIPREIEARLEVKGGSGSFNPDGRFRQIEGNEPDEGVWITDGYEDAANRIDLRLDVASGSVSIREP